MLARRALRSSYYCRPARSKRIGPQRYHHRSIKNQSSLVRLLPPLGPMKEAITNVASRRSTALVSARTFSSSASSSSSSQEAVATTSQEAAETEEAVATTNNNNHASTSRTDGAKNDPIPRAKRGRHHPRSRQHQDNKDDHNFGPNWVATLIQQGGQLHAAREAIDQWVKQSTALARQHHRTAYQRAQQQQQQQQQQIRVVEQHQKPASATAVATDTTPPNNESLSPEAPTALSNMDVDVAIGPSLPPPSSSSSSSSSSPSLDPAAEGTIPSREEDEQQHNTNSDDDDYDDDESSEANQPQAVAVTEPELAESAAELPQDENHVIDLPPPPPEKIHSHVFDAILQACATLPDRDRLGGGEFAEHVLRQEIKLNKFGCLLHDNNNTSSIPDEQQPILLGINPWHYRWAISAWTHSGHTDAGRRAEGILQELEAQCLLFHKNKNTQDEPFKTIMKPNVVDYNSVISAWTNQQQPRRNNTSNTTGNKNEVRKSNNSSNNNNNIIINNNMNKEQQRLAEIAQRAEDILQTMTSRDQHHLLFVEPDRITYHMVIKAHIAAGNAPAAQAILFQQISAANNNNNHSVAPERKNFHFVLEAWSDYDHEDAVAGAETLYELMESNPLLVGDDDDDDDDTNNDVCPDDFTNFLLLNTYANRGDGEGAEEAFRRFYEANQEDPDKNPPLSIRHVNTVVKAWSKSASPEAEDRMREIVDHVRLRFQDGSQPFGHNHVAYHLLLHRYAEKGDARAAVRLLDDMVQDYRSGNTDVKPNTWTFNLILKALSRLGGKKAGEQADYIRNEQMPLYGVKPDLASFRSSIQCWRLAGKAGHSGAKQRMEELSSRRKEIGKTVAHEV